MRCVLEKKSGLEMGGEIHPNMNHLCGGSAKGIARVRCRLIVAIGGLQSVGGSGAGGGRGASHHLN